MSSLSPVRVAVIGAGSWGTTVAALASRNAPTVLWARRPELAAEVADKHRNGEYLKGFDLPLATRLAWVADFPGVTLVPDRRCDGTNVLAVPTASGFRFSYGAGSFGRHRAETARLGLPARLVPDPQLAWDVDLPVDLAWPGAPGPPGPPSAGTTPAAVARSLLADLTVGSPRSS